MKRRKPGDLLFSQWAKWVKASGHQHDASTQLSYWCCTLPSEETASNMQHQLTTIGKLAIMVLEGTIFKITCTNST